MKHEAGTKKKEVREFRLDNLNKTTLLDVSHWVFNVQMYVYFYISFSTFELKSSRHLFHQTRAGPQSGQYTT